MHGSHEVESELGEVGEFLSVEGLGDQMGDDQTYAPQASRHAPDTREFGELEAMGVAQNYPRDSPTTIDEQTDSPPDLVSEVEKVSGQYRAHELIGNDGAVA